jgi:hypothetical protein
VKFVYIIGARTADCVGSTYCGACNETSIFSFGPCGGCVYLRAGSWRIHGNVHVWHAAGLVGVQPVLRGAVHVSHGPEPVRRAVSPPDLPAASGALRPCNRVSLCGAALPRSGVWSQSIPALWNVPRTTTLSRHSLPRVRQTPFCKGECRLDEWQQTPESRAEHRTMRNGLW